MQAFSATYKQIMGNFLLTNHQYVVFYYNFKLFFTKLGNKYPQGPKVTLSPTTIDASEGESADIVCSATGYPKPQIVWERLDGRMPTDVIIRDGFLRFNSLRTSDMGSYSCNAKNNVGEHDQLLQVFVRGSRPVAVDSVSVSPARFEGEPGEEIVLTCDSRPAGRITWSKAGSVELPRNAFANGAVLSIQYSTVDDSGRYVCHCNFPNGNTRSAHSDVVVLARTNQ